MSSVTTGPAGSIAVAEDLLRRHARVVALSRLSDAAGRFPAVTDEQVLRCSLLFDDDWYRSTYTDVGDAGMDPVLHYLAHGAAEGRDPGPWFSTRRYLDDHPDVALADVNALVHFERWGQAEGRAVPWSERAAPLPAAGSAAPDGGESRPDLATLRDSPLFDRDWYLDTYADVRTAGLDPAVHYLEHGAAEGRDPGPVFSTRGYLALNPDVAAAGMNSLLHYEQDGRREGRHWAAFGAAGPLTATDWLARRWEQEAPLPVYPHPTSEPRVTVAIDALDTSRLFGGVLTALVLGAALASHVGARLRVVTREEPPDAGTVGAILRTAGMAPPVALEVVVMPRNGSRSLAVGAYDYFITTSLWLTRSLIASVPVGRVCQLLQDDDRVFFPCGDDRVRCEETMATPGLLVAINSHLLKRHLTQTPYGIEGLLARSIAFEPAFPTAPSSLSRDPGDGRRRLFFYARPNHPRNLFATGLAALAAAISRGLFPQHRWEVCMVGSDVPDLVLPHGARPRRIEGLDWHAYLALVRTMDAGFCLMDSPHPSYPPLDLAAAGAAVLTNAHGLKTDLSEYSRNILTRRLSPDELALGLQELASLAVDDATRVSNLRADRIERDWSRALRPTVEHIAAHFGAARPDPAHLATPAAPK